MHKRQKKQATAKLEEQQAQIIDLHAQLERKSKDLTMAFSEN